MTVAEQLLQDLVAALDAAFISTWQSTAHWQKELDAAREYLAELLASERAANAMLTEELEHYRQRRGDPVAWLYEDELPDNYPYDIMFPYSKVEGVRMFPVYAPQSAEPSGASNLHNDVCGAQKGNQAPQPAEMVKLECPKCGSDRTKEPCQSDLMNCHFKGEAQIAAQKPDEPVKVLSDADLFAIHDEHFPTMVMGHDNYLRFARALLAAQMIETAATDAQRWRKARALPRSWWRDAFNRIAAEGVTLDELIDAEGKRRLP